MINAKMPELSIRGAPRCASPLPPAQPGRGGRKSSDEKTLLSAQRNGASGLDQPVFGIGLNVRKAQGAVIAFGVVHDAHLAAPQRLLKKRERAVPGLEHRAIHDSRGVIRL